MVIDDFSYDIRLTEYYPVRVNRDSFNLIDKIYTSITPLSYYLDAMQLGMKFDDNGTAILGYTLYY